MNPLQPPQRVAFAGDWHGDLAWACQMVWAAGQGGAQVILHTGDFGYEFRPMFLSRLTQALAVAGVRLLFVDGNHDDHHFLARQRCVKNGLAPLTDWIWYIPRGTRWRWHGLRFLGLGGAHSVDSTWRRRVGQMWQPEEHITRRQAQRAIASGKTDVLVAHDCPAGVDIPNLHPDKWPYHEIVQADLHRRLLRHVVTATCPQLIWHGHYHTRYSTAADLGYGPMQIHGLDCNGTSTFDNLHLVDLAELAQVCGYNSGNSERSPR